jgi:hypothetical protein
MGTPNEGQHGNKTAQNTEFQQLMQFFGLFIFSAPYHKGYEKNIALLTAFLFHAPGRAER